MRMTDRRAEQLARVPSFMFMAPPLGMIASVKVGTVMPYPAKRPLFESSRIDMLSTRKTHPKARVEYRPHQGIREIARRLARA